MSRAKMILVLNCGSSSVKYALYPLSGGAPRARGQIERIGNAPQHRVAGGTPHAIPGTPDHAGALDWLMDYLAAQSGDMEITCAGHRVVHGGRDFDCAALLTPDAMAKITALAPLAPAHQPHNLAGIAAVARHFPDLPQYASFDTAFHRTQSRLEQLYALPRALTDDGVLRYGFHGLSYDYIASQMPALLGDRATGRVAVLHLGNGASICGLLNGASVATSMGFTALDGLMMGRRCGDLDPGVVFHLARDRGLSLAEIEHLLSEESGLLGVSGISSDMRDLLASDSPNAAEAVNLFVLTATKQLGAITAALGGLDAIIFTGGIGENAAPVRAAIVDALSWLGLTLDPAANDARAPTITTATSRASAHVIATNEEQVIADHARELYSPPL